jgi:3-oxoacyl-[acyl-carrier protein] reductase
VGRERSNNGHRDGCALVTGSSRGIGAAAAERLAADGWPVAINYRSDESGAAEVVARIREAGGQATAIQADIAENGGVEHMVAEVNRELGQVAVLVNNAGVRADDLAPRIRDEAWRVVIETNLTAAHRCIRAVVMGMVKARWGRIVNVSSIVGIKANAGQANYAASKAGLIALTKTVAVETARRGVTANAVAPGVVDTAMTEGLTDEMLRWVPARRAGRTEEVAACIGFLASEEAAYVNGSVLTVDGGLTA